MIQAAQVFGLPDVRTNKWQVDQANECKNGSIR